MSLDIRNLTVDQRNLMYSLYLLNKENATLDSTSLQKFMFLITKNFPEIFRDYNQDYEPYDFGPYSEDVEHDASRLQNMRLLDNRLKVPEASSELIKQIERSDEELYASLEEYVRGMGQIGRDDLLYIVYRLYPDYTSRSRISHRIKSKNYETSVIDLELLKREKEIRVTTDRMNTLIVKLVNDRIRVSASERKDGEENGN